MARMAKEVNHNGFFAQFSADEMFDRLLEIPSCENGYYASAFLLAYSDFFAYNLYAADPDHRRINGLCCKDGRTTHYYVVQMRRGRGKLYPVFIDVRGETDSFEEFVPKQVHTTWEINMDEYGDKIVRDVDPIALNVALAQRYPEADYNEMYHSFGCLVEKYGFWKPDKNAVTLSLCTTI